MSLADLYEAVAPAVSVPDQVRNWISILASLGALGWIGRGIYTLRRDRKQSRVAERADSIAAEDSVVQHWKDVARDADARAQKSIEDERRRALDERDQKESAVRTVRGLLDLQEAQNESLAQTISRLTQTIDALTESAKAESKFRDELGFQIQALTAEKQKLMSQLGHAQREITKLTTDLMRKQTELLGMPTPTEYDAVNDALNRVHTGEIGTNGAGNVY